MTRETLSRFLTRCMLCIAMALLAVGTGLGVISGGKYLLFGGCALVALVLARLVLPRILPLFARLGLGKSWLILTALCIAVKLAWVLLVQVPLVGDYATFWSYAIQLSEIDVVYGRYMALFPHIYGYSHFLSGFIKLFGANPLLAQLLNVLLTVCAGTFLFLLLRDDPARAALAYLLWIFCPSQTMYNSLVLSEPLYTALLLGFALLVAEVWRWGGGHKPLLAGAVAGAAGGLLLRWINTVRPIALIPVIALLIWFFLLSRVPLNKGERRKLWFTMLPVLLACYFLTGPLVDAQIARRLGEEPAGIPGYNIYVGFNEASGGSWNAEDSALLFSYSDQEGATAKWAQEQMLAHAKKRISGGVNFPRLMAVKLRTFLGYDHVCVDYSAQAVPNRIGLLRAGCDSFWYFLILLALAGSIQLWREDCHGPMLMAPLYVIGLTLAQMLVEVAGRYHYSLIPALILVAACTVVVRRDGSAPKVFFFPQRREK